MKFDLLWNSWEIGLAINIVIWLLHFAWSIIIPLILSKINDEFSIKDLVFAVSSIEIANIILLIPELTSYSNFDEAFPICIFIIVGSTFAVTTMSVYLLKK